MLTLRFTSGPRAGRFIMLHAGQKTTIGRTDAADCAVLEDSFLSSCHFELSHRPDGVGILRDLQSRNGTFVNGQPIKEAQLRHGDIVRAGNSEFRVEMKSDGDEKIGEPHISLPSTSKPAESSPRAPASERLASPSSQAISTVKETAAAVGQVQLVAVQRNQEVRKLWLKPGESLTIGSSHQADATFEADVEMSRVHMRIMYDCEPCRIVDLGSTNGTHLNGEPVREAAVRSGDKILAGSTLFTVIIDSADPGDAPNQPLGFFQATLLPSGVSLFSLAPESEYAPLELLRKLQQYDRLNSILGPPLSDYRLQAFSQPLLSWLPDRIAKSISPMVFCASEQCDVLDMIETHWGQDRIACVLSTADPGTLCRQLTIAARGQTRWSAIPDIRHTIPDWRPSNLVTCLANSPPALCSPLFDVVTAIIVESEQPNQWLAIAQSRFDKTLAQIGLAPKPLLTINTADGRSPATGDL
jgi:pSer/pThr/pTyr-binding forkhead associated (FHA) protein